MKLFSVLTVMVAVSAMAGCASSYTNIAKTEDEDRFIVTEITQVPFGIVANVRSCEAQSDKTLVCTKID